MKFKSPFGSHTRKTDGCIVTFELENGERRVEHFSQVIRQYGGYAKQIETIGDPYLEQAAKRADELGAKIISVSTPDTILRDLQGSRRAFGVQRGQQYVADVTPFPESFMLGRIGRLDLFDAPSGSRDLQSRNITHVSMPRAKRTGRLGQ